MKKIVMVLLIAILAAGVTFAQEIQTNVGGGAYFDMIFGKGYKMTKPVDATTSQTLTSFGGFVFFDTAYAELDLTFGYTANGKRTRKSGSDSETIDGEGGTTTFGIGVLAKYPIELDDFTLYPMIGIHYDMWLSMPDPTGDDGTWKRSDYSDAGDADIFSLLAGAGMFLPFSDNLGLKADLLLRIVFPSKFEKDLVDLVNTISGADGKATAGFGPQIRVALQYSF